MMNCETVYWAFCTDTGELISPQPLRCGLYQARLHLEMWLTLHPEVNPLYTVLVEQTHQPDGRVTEQVYWRNSSFHPDLDERKNYGTQDSQQQREADTMQQWTESMARALQEDLISPEDFLAR